MKKAKLLMVEDEADVLEINREYFEGNGFGQSCRKHRLRVQKERVPGKTDL